MDRGDGYDRSLEVRSSLLPRRKPSPYNPAMRSTYNVNEIPIPDQEAYVDPYQPVTSGTRPGYAPRRPDRPPPPSHNSSESTLKTPNDLYSYQPPSSSPLAYVEPKPEHQYSTFEIPPFKREADGLPIQTPWRRHLLNWLVAFFAVCAFVFTTIFAWNATAGGRADTRLLFDAPGRTILVLQILTNLTTSLLGELVIASAEMLRWALATRGTKFTTFLGLSRATALYGMLYLFFSRQVHGYTKFWVLQRFLIYGLIFTISFILLSNLSIPLSFPVLVAITNGSSGLGPFGTTNPTFSLPAFHFTGFTQDSSSVIGVPPTCTDEDCLSYFLPGGLANVNGSWYHLTNGVQGLNGTSAPPGGLLGGDPPASDPLGGLLDGLVKRQLGTGSIGSLSTDLNQVAGNSINWTEFSANQTKEFGVKDPAYLTYNAQGYRLDFSPYTGEFPQYNKQCATYSVLLNQTLIACIGTESDVQNSSSLVGGLQVCDPLGFFGNPCTSDETVTLQYTTRLQIRISHATTAYSLRNATILSISEESTPIDYPVNVAAFFQAFTSPFQQSQLFATLDALTNDNASSSLTSQLVLSLIADFAFSGQGPLDGPHQLRNLMSYAMVIGSLLQDEVANSGQQAVTKVVYTVHIAPMTLYLFIVLGSLILLWCLPIMVWSTLQVASNTSGFPEVDFASKIVPGVVEGLSNAESKGIGTKLGGDTQVFLGEGVGGSGKVAVVLDTAPLGILRKDVVYN